MTLSINDGIQPNGIKQKT